MTSYACAYMCSPEEGFRVFSWFFLRVSIKPEKRWIKREDCLRNVTNCTCVHAQCQQVCMWVFWWDTASQYSFLSKLRSIPPLFFPSTLPLSERTLYYHQYLLCSARRERNRSWAINSGLTQCRNLLLSRLGHGRSQRSTLVLGEAVTMVHNNGLRNQVLPAPLTGNRHQGDSFQLLLCSFHWYIYTEGLLQTESC